MDVDGHWFSQKSALVAKYQASEAQRARISPRSGI